MILRTTGTIAALILALGASAGCASRGHVEDVDRRLSDIEQRLGEVEEQASAAERAAERSAKQAGAAASSAREAERTSKMVFEKSVSK